jgi:hypothetical protein
MCHYHGSILLIFQKGLQIYLAVKYFYGILLKNKI